MNFRDPDTGFWCDTLRLENFVPCGAQNNFYSSAGTGMGLVSEAIMVELGQSNIYFSCNENTGLRLSDKRGGYC